MKVKNLFILLSCFFIFQFFFSIKGFSESLAPVVSPTSSPMNPMTAMTPIIENCETLLKSFPGSLQLALVKTACSKISVLDACKSVQGLPIFHYDKRSLTKEAPSILVFSVIHGDELPAGTVGRFWMERLESIEPRNHWRVIPVLNPDGLKLLTRTNFNKVDINRNFPTKDWKDKALVSWKKDFHSNPRRFPGSSAASEPETICAMKHIDDFKPDFIVAIHTPLKVLDFDGPKVRPPKFDYLPWKNLGHFPGSLGRYMWFERKTPVLTMELKEDLPGSQKPFEQLQDIIGYLVHFETSKKGITSSKSEKKEAPLTVN